MLVLGIDPGIAITGCAVIEDKKGKSKLIASEAILTNKTQSHPKRLSLIYKQLKKIVKKNNPQVAVIESLFFAANAKTALIVGQARGVVNLALFEENIPVVEYTPLQVKMALTGYGRADKKQIQQMVKNILNLKEILKPDDVADAAAIALTHCFSDKMNKSVKR